MIEKKSKHRYSTYLVIAFMCLFAIAIAGANLVSEDVDDLCNQNNMFLYRFGGVWGCGNLSGTNVVFNYTTNNITINNIIQNFSLFANYSNNGPFWRLDGNNAPPSADWFMNDKRFVWNNSMEVFGDPLTGEAIVFANTSFVVNVASRPFGNGNNVISMFTQGFTGVRLYLDAGNSTYNGSVILGDNVGTSNIGWIQGIIRNSTFGSLWAVNGVPQVGSTWYVNGTLRSVGNLTAPNICYSNGSNCAVSATDLTNVSYLNNTQTWFVGANQTFQGKTMVRDGSGGNGNAALTVIQQTTWSGALPYSLNLTTNTSNGLGFFYAHGFRIGGAEGPAGGNLRHLQRVTGGNLDFSTSSGSITFSPNDDKLVLKVDPTFWATINGSLNVSVNARTNRNMTVNNSLDIGAGLSSRRANVGGVVHSNVSNSNNTGTTETNLYGYSIRANTLFFDGDTIRCRIVIKSAGSATATSQYNVMFAGNKVYDSGALGFSVATDTVLDIEVIRDNLTTVEVVTTAFTTNASAIPYAIYTPLKGISFNSDNPVNVTGTRGGVGAATGDISAKNWRCEFLPAGAGS